MFEKGALGRWQSDCDRIYVANVVSVESLPSTGTPCQYQWKAVQLLWKMARQTVSKRLWCMFRFSISVMYCVCVYVCVCVCVCGPIKASLLTFLLQVSGGWIYGACLEAWGGLAGHELVTQTRTLIHTHFFLLLTFPTLVGFIFMPSDKFLHRAETTVDSLHFCSSVSKLVQGLMHDDLKVTQHT